MPKTTRADDKKRLDPYDPRTGATGNDEPEGKRSSPGSGEDQDVNGTADLQPDDVEDGDTAR
jgi:hypothetical protein